MPAAAESCDLQLEKAIVFEHVAHLVSEFLLLGDPDVLGHLHACDSVLFAVLWQVPHVHDIYSHLFLDSHFSRFIFDEICLFLAESDASRTHVLIFGRVVDQRAPTAAQIQVLHTLFHLHHLANLVELSLLCHF